MVGGFQGKSSRKDWAVEWVSSKGSSKAAARTSREDLELARIQERYRLLRWIVLSCGVAVAIVSTRVPLEAVRLMVEAVAGKQTDVRLLLTASVSIAVALSATVAFTVARIQAQKKEITRLRNRVTELESQLLDKPNRRGGSR